MKKKVLGLVLSLIVSSGLAACGSSQQSASEADKSSSATSTTSATSASTSETVDSGSATTSTSAKGDYTGVHIAYLTPSLDVPFWIYVKHGVEDEVEKTMPGAEVTVYDSKDNANTQLSNAQDALTKGVTGIVISPTDSASCVQVLDAAEEANVPVVICDIGTDSGTYLSFISTDNESGAKELGEYVASKLNKGDKVAQITLNQARINGVKRKEGFEEGIKANDLQEVDFRQMEKVNRDEGVSYTQDLITSYPDLKAIFCHSEDPSMGAVTALEEVGNTDCKIVGFDCSPEVVQAIKDGKILATAAQQPVVMGRTSVDSIKTKLDGGTPEKEIQMKTLLVTQDNINDIYDELQEKSLAAD